MIPLESELELKHHAFSSEVAQRFLDAPVRPRSSSDGHVPWDQIPGKSIAVTDKKTTSVKTKFKNASKNILHKI